MLADGLRFVMRAVHTGAFAVWLGSGLFYLLIGPAVRRAIGGEAWTAMQGVFHRLTRPAFALLLGSGVYLLFDRLAEPRLGVAYVIVLVAKLALVGGIVWVLGTRRREQPKLARRRRRDPARVVLILGAGAVLLGVLMTLIYESQAAGF